MTQFTGQARVRARTVNKTTSEQHLAQAARDPVVNVRYRVARNKATTPEILHELVHDTETHVKYACAMHAALAPADVEYLARTGPTYRILERLAQRKDITAVTVSHIVRNAGRIKDDHTYQNPEYAVKQLMTRLADNPYLDSASLQHVLDWADQQPPANLGDITVGFLHTERPGMTGRQAAQAAKLFAAAYNSGTQHNRWKFSLSVRQPLPFAVLLDTYQKTQIPSLLSNPGFSWGQALKLVQEIPTHRAQDATVSLLQRPDCPTDFMRSCDQDDEKIATGVAKNRHCPSDIHAQLTRSPYDQVRAAAVVTCKDPQLLRQLADDLAPSVRTAIVRNRRTPPEILDRFVDDPDQTVRQLVASNLNCPLATLEKLLRDEQPWVASTAAQNRNLPSHVRAMWQLVHR